MRPPRELTGTPSPQCRATVGDLPFHPVGLRGAGVARAALVAVAVAVEACYPMAGPPPGALSSHTVASASARWPGVSAATLDAGHDLFLAKCNGCHRYPALAPIPDERWPDIVDKMGDKSHLSADERIEVLRYILSARSELATK